MVSYACTIHMIYKLAKYVPFDFRWTRRSPCVAEGTLPGAVDTGRNLTVTAIFCSTELFFGCSWWRMDSFDSLSASEKAEATELQRMIAVEQQKAQFQAQVCMLTAKMLSRSISVTCAQIEKCDVQKPALVEWLLDEAADYELWFRLIKVLGRKVPSSSD